MNEEIEEVLQREGIELASIQKRAVATFIDEILLSFLLMIALYDSFANATTMEEIIAITNTFLIEFLLLKIFYQAFFTMQYGATLGKIVMKIQVLELSTLSKPNVITALNRAFFRVWSELFLYMGFLWAMFDPQKQSWHDKTAKTLVINA